MSDSDDCIIYKEAITCDQVVVNSEGLFIIDLEGNLTPASAIFSTNEGLFALKKYAAQHCIACGFPIMNGVCHRDTCDMKGKKQ
jgi:hypothetical protein